MGDFEGGVPSAISCSSEDDRRVRNEIAPIHICGYLEEALALIKKGEYEAAYYKLEGTFLAAEQKFAALKQKNPDLSVYDWYVQMLGKDFLRLYFYIPEDVLTTVVDSIPPNLLTYVMDDNQTLEDKVNMIAGLTIRYLSLLRTESEFNPKALAQKKEKGKVVFEAKGIGQLTEETAKETAAEMVRLGGYSEEWAAKYNIWDMKDNIRISFYYFVNRLHQLSGPLYITLGTDDNPKAEIGYKYGHNGIGRIWEKTCQFDTKCFFEHVKGAEGSIKRLEVFSFWYTRLYRDRIVQMIKERYYPELLEAPEQPASIWLQIFGFPQQKAE